MKVAALIDALEAAAALPAEPSLEDVAASMAARAPVLDVITGLDPSSLEAPERAALKEALSRIQARDADTLAALEDERERVGGERAKLAHARGMVRGYRNVAPHGRGAVLRTA